MNNKITNPILSGFYPDPSICRVNDDYYMITSSFELYPGIPIFHSRDLANWEQIGFALTKENEFHVTANAFAGGVMAPTIRYNNGIFYIIVANFGHKGNFIITAKDPKGPWSKPYWLEENKDIDTSIFFDHDGKVYLVYPSNVKQEVQGEFKNERGIFVREFDIDAMKPIGDFFHIWDSALRGASSPESPHIYHIGDYYYLIIAEGGTEHYHAVTVARSKELTSWFEGNPANPVMTHRQFGFDYPITNIGHADLVETPSGEWYAVMLGSRLIDGYHKNLGRESFVCPVIFERDWPVFSPKSGKVDFEYELPKNTKWTPFEKIVHDDFDEFVLNLQWNFWGTPYTDFWNLEESKLKLKCLSRELSYPLRQIQIGNPDLSKDNNISLVVTRQRDINFEAYCNLNFKPQNNEAAGFVMLQACNHHIRIEKILINNISTIRVVLATTEMSGPPYLPGFTSTVIEETLAEQICDSEDIIFGVKVKRQNVECYFGKTKENLTHLCDVDARKINPEFIGGIAGTMIGMFATGNGVESSNYAEFDWFDYEKI